ncbi:MAG TPA: cupin domain-containing protein [Acidimicrobiales bacterium]|nr:cupin domain-containing protein [Acidimicrobiales bacterium]
MTSTEPDGWHRPLHHTPAGALDPGTAQTPGMRRSEAISGRLCGSESIWMGETVVEPAVASADHHHGESETGIYVTSGHPAFVFLDPATGVERRIEAGPGDYVYVPPWTPHREENPSPDEPAVVVIARSTQEAIVVNLSDLRGTPAGSG